MRLKKESLLEKLKKENQINQSGSNAINEIISKREKLKPNTILTKKIDEIKSLQIENNLISTNKIFEILDFKFEYSYPFYFKVNEYKSKLNVSNDELRLSNNLIDHVKREVSLNLVKQNFNRAKNYVKRISDLEASKKSVGTMYSTLFLLFSIAFCVGVFGILIFFLFSYYYTGISAYIVMGSLVLGLITLVLQAIHTKSISNEIKPLEKSLRNEIEILKKTKANIV